MECYDLIGSTATAYVIVYVVCGAIRLCIRVWENYEGIR